MAQNTLQFSEVIDQLTTEEFSWWLAVDNAIAREDRITLDALVDHRVGDAGGEILDMYEGLTLSLYEVERKVHLYASEYADIGVVGTLVCEFTRQFRSGDTFYLTWATACSKMRPGEFGGGILLVDDSGWDTLEAQELCQLTRSQLRAIHDLTRAG